MTVLCPSIAHCCTKSSCPENSIQCWFLVAYFYGTVCSLTDLHLALEIPSYQSMVFSHLFWDLSAIFILAFCDISSNELMVSWLMNSSPLSIMASDWQDHCQCDHPHLLCVYSHHHPEGVLCWGKMQILFHLCLPHHSMVVFQGIVIFIYCQKALILGLAF